MADDEDKTDGLVTLAESKLGRYFTAVHPFQKELDEESAKQKMHFDGLLAADHDTIGRVLRAHLIVEQYLNIYLYNKFGFDDEVLGGLKYAQKASMLPKDPSTPVGHWRAGVKQLNAIRNGYGHDLNKRIGWDNINVIVKALEGMKFDKKSKLPDEPILVIEKFAYDVCAYLAFMPADLRRRMNEALRKVGLDDWAAF